MIQGKGEGVVGLGFIDFGIIYTINVYSINDLLLLEIYWLLWYIKFFKKYSIKRFFSVCLLWSNRSRFRLCCTNAFYICVDFYLTYFLPYVYVFTVQRLGSKAIGKTISKIILLLVFKITESLKCTLKCKR